MHYLLRTLFLIGILTSLLAIYAIEAASILSAGGQETGVNDKCARGGSCDQDIPCCNRCKVNWGGAWCT